MFRLAKLRPALIAVAVFVAGAAWALSSPVGSAPDEDYHLTSIWCPPPLESSGCARGVDDRGRVGVLVPALVARPQCFATKAQVSGACQAALASEPPMVSTRVDQGEYPPLFYRAMHVFAGPQVGRSVLLMRLANLALAIALVGAVLLAGGPTLRRRGGYAVLATVVPLSAFLVPSANPTSWAVSGMAAQALAMLGMPAARAGRRQALLGALALVSAALAAGARGDAGVFVGVVAIAIVVATGWRRWLSPSMGVVPVIAVGLGMISAWSARQVAGVLGDGDPSAAQPLEVIVRSIGLELPGLLLGSTGVGRGLGWMDTPLPTATTMCSLAVLAGVALVGLLDLDRRKSLALAFVVGTMVGIPVTIMLRQHLVVGNSIQPRYLLPLVAPAVMLVLGRADDGSARLSRPQTLACITGVAIANAAALSTNLTRYTVGLQPRGEQGADGPWWWPVGPGPATVWLVGSLAGLLAASAVLSFAGPEKDTDEGRDGALTRVTHDRGPASPSVVA